MKTIHHLLLFAGLTAGVCAAGAAPAPDETRFFEVALGEKDEEPAPEPEDDSDTAKIYGTSPYTPKPRFNFSDLRFGKDYKDEDQEDK